MKMYASADHISRWEDIDFHVAEQNVKKLQRRIAAAFRNSELDKAASLQEKLIHSFFAKALAVKVVTSNVGKHTAGIDGIVWETPEQKIEAVYSLCRRGYKPRPAKRVYIRKSGGGVRPLSIPTMMDRAMQTLYKFALEPIAEAMADSCSFGFRRSRSAKDAILRFIDILSLNDDDDVWTLKVDIQSCFDSISHDWLIAHIPMDKKMLSKFIACGYVDQSGFHPTTQGVPQGGCLSSVICNMTLDGLEAIIRDSCENEVQMVRYADDIVVVSDSLSTLVQSVLPIMERFLQKRGLQFSQEKTKLIRIERGLTFLGYQICKKDGAILAVPSERNKSALMKKIVKISSVLRETPLDSLSYSSLKYLYDMFRWTIRGWVNYFNGIVDPAALIKIQQQATVTAVNASKDERIAETIQKIFDGKDGESNVRTSPS